MCKNTSDHSNTRGLNQKATKNSVLFLQMLHARHAPSFTADAKRKMVLAGQCVAGSLLLIL